MKTAIAIRHVPFEDLGLLRGVLAEAGYKASYLEAGAQPLDRDELDAADLLIILGGPIAVYDREIYPFLNDEIAASARRLDAGRPLLGICLGAQIIARAAGEKVYPSGVKELGWQGIDLTAAGRKSVLAPIAETPVLHWHGDTFDLPKDAQLLASTALVRNQAFAMGPTALGLQFHLEAEEANLETWYIGHAGELAAASGVSVPSLRLQGRELAPRLAPLARRVFKDWLAALP